MNVPESELIARVLRGCVGTCLTKPLSHYRDALAKFDVLSWENDKGLIDFLQLQLSKRLPEKPSGRISEACERAFGEGIGRQNAVRLRLWMFTADPRLPQTERPAALPFPEKDCLAFIFAFLDPFMTEQEAVRLQARAEIVETRVRETILRSAWKDNGVRNALLAEFRKDAEAALRRFPRLKKACRKHGVPDHVLTTIFDLFLVHTATKGAAEHFPPYLPQTGT